MGQSSPDDDPALQKARREVALVALIVALAAAVALILFNAQIRIDPRALAAGVVGWAFLLPALAIRGPLSDRRAAGALFAAATVGVAAWVATGSALPTAACLPIAAGGAIAHYRIAHSTTYRPRMPKKP
jgi:hypothetical protein